MTLLQIAQDLYRENGNRVYSLHQDDIKARIKADTSITGKQALKDATNKVQTYLVQGRVNGT